jgi:hypothetical protein
MRAAASTRRPPEATAGTSRPPPPAEVGGDEPPARNGSGRVRRANEVCLRDERGDSPRSRDTSGADFVGGRATPSDGRCRQLLWLS